MIKSKLSAFLFNEDGATAIEYALIASIISICIVVGLTQIQSSLRSTFNNVGTQLTTNGK
jgi:pilus assembly protein Flp/PilA